MHPNRNKLGVSILPKLPWNARPFKLFLTIQVIVITLPLLLHASSSAGVLKDGHRKSLGYIYPKQYKSAHFKPRKNIQFIPRITEHDKSILQRKPLAISTSDRYKNQLKYPELQSPNLVHIKQSNIAYLKSSKNTERLKNNNGRDILRSKSLSRHQKISANSGTFKSANLTLNGNFLLQRNPKSNKHKGNYNEKIYPKGTYSGDSKAYESTQQHELEFKIGRDSKKQNKTFNWIQQGLKTNRYKELQNLREKENVFKHLSNLNKMKVKKMLFGSFKYE